MQLFAMVWQTIKRVFGYKANPQPDLETGTSNTISQANEPLDDHDLTTTINDIGIPCIFDHTLTHKISIQTFFTIIAVESAIIGAVFILWWCPQLCTECMQLLASLGSSISTWWQYIYDIALEFLKFCCDLVRGTLRILVFGVLWEIICLICSVVYR